MLRNMLVWSSQDGEKRGEEGIRQGPEAVPLMRLYYEPIKHRTE